MDALPDELLLLIFGFVDDGVTLLDAVPLVCKRWHRVSKDPRAWASAVVSVRNCVQQETCDYHLNPYKYDRAAHNENMTGPYYSDNHKEILSVARVIQHAPFFRLLQNVEWYDSRSGYSQRPCLFEADVVKSALRRCTATVRELFLSKSDMDMSWHSAVDSYLDQENPEDSQVDSLVNLMARSKRSLRALDLGPLLTLEKVKLSVSQLTGLEHLSLILDGKLGSAGGALDGALPNLKRLRIVVGDDEGEGDLQQPSSDYNGVVSHIVVLIRGAAGSLRQLHLKQVCDPPSPAIAAEVRRCERLRELSCDLAYTAVLPQLRSLSLVTHCRFGVHDVERDVAALNAATDALQRGGQLAHLRHLHVELTDGFYEHSSVDRVETGLESLLRALTFAAPGVTDLNLSVVDFPNAGLFLKRMPRLRSLSLTDFISPLSDLAVLADLSDLENLTIDFKGGRLPDVDDDIGDGDTVLYFGVALGRLRRLQKLHTVCLTARALQVLATLPDLTEVTGELWCFGKSEGVGHCDTEIDLFQCNRPDVELNMRICSDCLSGYDDDM